MKSKWGKLSTNLICGRVSVFGEGGESERANDDDLIPDPERSGRRENSTNSTRNGRQMTSPGSATRIIDNESLFCRSSDAIAKYSGKIRKTTVICLFALKLVYN
jgi:hypothetical protein